MLGISCDVEDRNHIVDNICDDAKNSQEKSTIAQIFEEGVDCF